jgi:hypothetical protein
MKNFFGLVLFVCLSVSSQQTFGSDQCLTGRCLRAPVQLVSGVAESAVEAVGAVGNAVAGVAGVVVNSPPVQAVTTVTRSVARKTVGVARRPFKSLRRW